jgi:hypothetical protein
LRNIPPAQKVRHRKTPAPKVSTMIKIKPEPKPPKAKDSPAQAAETESTRHIAENAVHGGPKDVKKDKRSGAGRGQKG